MAAGRRPEAGGARDGGEGRTLFLLRHAKSSWDDPALADRERPLAPRGRRAAATIARHVRERGIAPELVLCSPAERTRQTLDLVSAGFPALRAPRIEYDAGIYEASSDELLAILRMAPEGDDAVMLIGHQPSIQDLALALTGPGPESERLGGKFPTAAMATFSVPGEWSALGPGEASLVDYVKPKDLDHSRP